MTESAAAEPAAVALVFAPARGVAAGCGFLRIAADGADEQRQDGESHEGRAEDGRVLAYFALDAREGSFVLRDGALERIGELVIFDVTGPGDVVGRDVHVESTVRDVGGTTRTVAVDAMIVDREP